MRLIRALFPTIGLLLALLGGGALANMPSTGGGLLIAGQSPFIQASCSGCTITTNGNQRIYTFNSSGSLTVTSVPAGQTGAVLVVGGAGGSGCVATATAGAGGGGSGGVGGVSYNAAFGLTVTTYTVTVGAAGTRCSSGVPPTAGTSSIFGSITCTGGGLGGYYNGSYVAGGNGAHGGGGGGGGATAGGTGSGSCSTSNGGAGSTGGGGSGGGAGAQGCGRRSGRRDLRHALTNLREELRRLKQMEIEVTNDYMRRRDAPVAYSRDLTQLRLEQDETREAIRLIETKMGMHR